MTSPFQKLLPYRRPILLVVAGLTIASMYLTLRPVVPRSVDVVARLGSPELRARPSSLVISSGGRTVVEAEASPDAVEGSVLEYTFQLSPGRHELEFRVRGCAPLTRTFDPGDQGLVAFDYRCAAAAQHDGP
jgi:hypothetical protein